MGRRDASSFVLHWITRELLRQKPQRERGQGMGYAIAYDVDSKAFEDAGKDFTVQTLYNRIHAAVKEFGFTPLQHSVVSTSSDDIADVFRALMALRAVECFAEFVSDLHVFRMDVWSDVKDLVTEPLPDTGK